MTSTIPHRLAPADRYGYLDPKVTGSPWLLDPVRMPDNQYSGFFATGETVDQHAAAADLRAYASLLDDAYARVGRYAQRGVEMHALLEEHARRVEALPGAPLAVDAFIPALADLRAALPDNHLGMGVSDGWDRLDADPRLQFREFRGDASKLDAAAGASGAIRATAQVVPVLDGPIRDARRGSISIQGRDGETQLRALGYRPVDEIVPYDQLVPVPETGAYSYREAGDVGIVRLTSFGADGVAAKELQQFVKDAPLHRGKSKLIVDMRGNSGGNDGYMREWIQQFLDQGTELANPYSDSSGFGSGKQYATSMWNWSVFAGKYMGDDPLQRPFIELGRATKSLWPLGPSTPIDVELEGEPTRGTAKTSWEGDLVVLVDRRNASSGESAALHARDSLGARVVGERTGGYLQGINVATYQLPNTGLPVFVPSIDAVWKDTRALEGAGIPVDIALQDPSASAESIAQSLWGAAAVQPQPAVAA